MLERARRSAPCPLGCSWLREWRRYSGDMPPARGLEIFAVRFLPAGTSDAAPAVAAGSAAGLLFMSCRPAQTPPIRASSAASSTPRRAPAVRPRSPASRVAT